MPKRPLLKNLVEPYPSPNLIWFTLDGMKSGTGQCILSGLDGLGRSVPLQRSP